MRSTSAWQLAPTTETRNRTYTHLGLPAVPPRKLDGTRMQKLNQLAEQRRETALPIPDGPPDSRKVLLQVISRSLDPEPAQRYQSGAEFADALDGCHRLRRAEIDLPTPGRLTRAALARPMLWLILFALLPHLAGSLVNVAYNNEQIIQQLREPQRELFTKLVLGYNVVIYPLALWLGWRILRPVWRCWRALAGSQRIDSHDVAAARRRALQLPVWAAGLAGLGWLPGGLLFPTLIDAWQGDVGWTVYAHFLVSFTLSGLIALAYSYCGVHYVVLRVLYPSMWLNPGGFEAQARQELRRVPLRQSLIPHLATSIPVLAVRGRSPRPMKFCPQVGSPPHAAPHRH